MNSLIKYTSSIFLVVILFSCTDNNLTPLRDLNGKWVETTRRKDTILFDQNIDSADKLFFIFKSDKEIKGYNKLYSSIYEYKVIGLKISIYNTLLSCYCFTDYKFSTSNGKLLIENFYSQKSTGQIETFEKIK